MQYYREIRIAHNNFRKRNDLWLIRLIEICLFYENYINNKADDYAKATLKSLPTSNTNKFKGKEIFRISYEM